MTQAAIPAVNVGAAHPYPSGAVAWYATAVLAFMYWMSVLDRFIISLLVGPIKRDLGITDTQFALLNGFGFAFTFCLLGLIAGSLADRYARRWIIFAGVAIWSLSTAFCGVVQNYWQLLMMRVGVGVGEAALMPSATSMLTDLFPREKLTSAMAFYSIGSVLGSGCAFMFGGLLISLVSHTLTMALPLIGEVRSWQAVFLLIGIPGGLLSLLIFSVPEPVRRGQRATGSGLISWIGAYRDLLIFIRSRPGFFSYHYVGFCFATAIVVGAGTWYPAHMSRSFGWSSSEIGLTLGLMLGIGGLLSQMLCGRIVDSMYKRGYRDAQFRWYAFCMAAATPLGIIANTTSNPWVFIGFQECFIILASSLGATVFSSLNLVTPNALRGSGVAFYSATSGLISSGTGPILIAIVSDRVFHDETAIGLATAVVIAICCPVAAILLWLGRGSMRKAVMMNEQA